VIDRTAVKSSISLVTHFSLVFRPPTMLQADCGLLNFSVVMRVVGFCFKIDV
jgi:hypothetical protein